MGSGYRVFTAGEVLSASNVQNYLQDQAVMVFGGTAARSSAIGTANFEEGMLTYLTDVDKLQVYTGAAFADVYPAAATNQGLTLINTTSFSAVASVSLAADTFTTTYDRYKVFFTVSSVSTNNQLQFRLRKAGTNSSTGYYYGNQAHRSNNTANNYGGANDPAWFFYDMQSAYNNEVNLELTVNFPATSTPTSMFVVGHSMDGSNNTQGYTAACAHRVTDTYDSATFLSQAGATMTGSYSVYGLNK